MKVLHVIPSLAARTGGPAVAAVQQVEVHLGVEKWAAAVHVLALIIAAGVADGQLPVSVE